MLATVIIVGGYLYLRLDDEIRRYAENVFSTHYRGFDVQLGSARFEAGRGITLHKLSIREPTSDGAMVPVAEIEELELLGKFDVDTLSTGRLEIESIQIKSPHINAVRHTDGKWNVSDLFPLPTTGSKPVTVTIVGAVIAITDLEQPRLGAITLRGVNVDVTSEQLKSDSTESFQGARTYHAKGFVGGGIADKFQFHADFQTGSRAMNGGAIIEGLDLSSAVAKSLFALAPQSLAVTDLDGRASLELKVQRTDVPDAKFTWNAGYRITDARLSVSGLPRPITEITASGTATHGRLSVREARGDFGKASVRLACERYGWSKDSPIGLRMQVERLTFDENLVEVLPPAAHTLCDRLQPAGEMGISLAVRFDGKRWNPDVTLHCRDVSFEDREKFPYRVRNSTGTVRIFTEDDGHGSVVDIDLLASAGSTPVTIRGRFKRITNPSSSVVHRDHPPPPPIGWVEVIANELTISDELTHALKPQSARIVELLNPTGQVSVRWRFERSDLHAPPHTETDLTFHNARIKFEKFPYPLSHIQGAAFERDGSWRFEDLVSRDPHGSRVIRAYGTCTKQADGHHLSLTFLGEQVPLDDTLRLALSAEQQQTWAAIRPNGRVKFRADVRHHIGADEKPDIQVVLEPLPKVVSIEPVCFPYRLENLQGLVAIQNGQFSMTGMRAAHGQTTFESDAVWVPNSRGGWQLRFSKLHVDRLSADYDLKRAAPSGVGKLIEYLKPNGTFSVHDGTLWFSKDVAGSPHLRSEWRISLGCQQNGLELGVPLDSVSGIVHLAGRHEGNRRFTAGQLDLDSAFWNGMQLTQIRGPIWVDTKECRLGQGATDRMNEINQQQETPQKVKANLYGGNLTLNANVQLNAGSRYVVAAELDRCDLARMSNEYFGGSVDLTGTMSGEATINGMGQSIDLLEGGGRMAVRDASMYELPVMARLLKVLRNRVPDKTAFNGVDAKFSIVGKSIQFSQLDLLGDAVSLHGTGSATFDRHLDLVFHSTVGRSDFGVPLLRSMIGQASANLLLIKVTGTADNPDVYREPLPAVNEFVEQLQGDAVASPQLPGTRFWRR